VHASSPRDDKSHAIVAFDKNQQLTLPAIELSASRAQLPPERAKRIYCNRSIRLDQIEWVGFDMDYTLAIYDQPRMDELTVRAALPKLIARGYPDSLAEIHYDFTFPVRGLIIDAKLGNVLKMDRYKYVKRAYHGTRELSYDQKRELYHSQRIRAKRNPRYHFIDSLYALSEVTMFATGVTHMEGLGMSLDYQKWFADIRDAVDRSHQDGSILDHIIADPGGFIVRDPLLPHALHKLRSAGKKLFVLTNSQPAYTERIMRFLLEGQLPEYKSWKQLFDVIVTATRKPRFFIEEDLPFGYAPGHENGSSEVRKIERGRIYTGGCVAELSRLCRIDGDRVLYVGDHIYGDVLRAKKHSAWRTAMIIQELEDELIGVHATADDADRWDRLEEARRALSDELRSVQARLKENQRLDGEDPAVEAERVRLKRRVERTRARIRAVEGSCAQIEQDIETRFHNYWGPLLKAGAELSSFGHQVEAYACLYTGRVSNFLGYSPMHYFRSPRDRLPHE
jgi:HAD superfamily 5'-nucleotidase-like hydrolase